MKKYLLIALVLLAIIIYKVITGPPPPGYGSWAEAFNLSSKKDTERDLPRMIKDYPVTTKKLYDEVKYTFEENLPTFNSEIEELTSKAIHTLPNEEKLHLLALHERFNKGGYGILSEEEIRIMQHLNNKAINLLDNKDRERLTHILGSMEEITHNRISLNDMKLLVGNLSHPDTAVRWHAINVLKELGTEAKAVVNDIIPYLKHDEWRVRYYTADILGAIGKDAKSAIPSLKEQINDQNKYVRERVSWAIKMIEDKDIY